MSELTELRTPLALYPGIQKHIVGELDELNGSSSNYVQSVTGISGTASSKGLTYEGVVRAHDELLRLLAGANELAQPSGEQS